MSFRCVKGVWSASMYVNFDKYSSLHIYFFVYFLHSKNISFHVLLCIYVYSHVFPFYFFPLGKFLFNRVYFWKPGAVFSSVANKNIHKSFILNSCREFYRSLLNSVWIIFDFEDRVCIFVNKNSKALTKRIF